MSSFQLLNYLPFVESTKELLELKQRPMVQRINSGEQFREIVAPYIERKLNGVKAITQLKQSGAGEGFLNLAREKHFESCTHNRRLSNLWSTIK